MTQFAQRGSRFNVFKDADMTVLPKLPTGTYTINYDMQIGAFYLDSIENFEWKGKIYGDVMKTVNRFLDTYEDRPGATGVLLEGEKGTGKTMLAKLLSIEGYKRDYITVVISQPWHGEQFNEFVQAIDQPAIFLFDEFEKVYDVDRDQSKILTLLDGTYNTKKMFIMTCNDRARLSYYMINRPGRFFYNLKYKGLSQEFIQDYCDDNLENKAHTDLIKRFALTFNDFTFDILKAIVEEMNRYQETLKEVLQYLNVSSTGSQRRYQVTKFELKGEEKFLSHDECLNDGEYINVFNGFQLYFENANEDSDFYFVRFDPEHITRFDSNGRIVAENDKAIIEAEYKQDAYHDYLSLIG